MRIRIVLTGTWTTLEEEINRAIGDIEDYSGTLGDGRIGSGYIKDIKYLTSSEGNCIGIIHWEWRYS